GGCYKREIFEKIGLFNEKLVRSQDMDFNSRLKKAGLKILLVPDIVTYYYARSDLKSFIIHNFMNGLW
ncbi:MAG TPA: glycosyl transferase, partial [Elusimicrobia bacterium]|nr:glycosyl transferase [Elusimicrobiota bacterium]